MTCQSTLQPPRSTVTYLGGFFIFVVPPTLAGNTRFYAVRVGRTPGVYVSWGDAAEQVNGYSGNTHQKFATFEEAAAFVWGPAWAELAPWYYHPGGASATERRRIALAHLGHFDETDEEAVVAAAAAADAAAMETPGAGPPPLSTPPPPPGAVPPSSPPPPPPPEPRCTASHATPVHFAPGPFPREDPLPGESTPDENEAILYAARVQTLNKIHRYQLHVAAQSVPVSQAPYALSPTTFFATRPAEEHPPVLPRSRVASSTSSLATPSETSTASISSTSVSTAIASETPAATTSDIDNVTAGMTNVAVDDVADTIPTRHPGEAVPRRSLTIPAGLDVDGDLSSLSDAVVGYLDHHRWDDSALEVIAAAARISLPRHVVKFKCTLAKAGMSEWEAGTIWDELKEGGH